LGGKLTVAKKRTKSKINPKLAKRILKTVLIQEAFLFFTGFGQFTGEFAPSLADLLKKLKKIPLKSIEFHFKRGDFERWIRETLGDEYLASKISKIDMSTQGEELRAAIERMVKRRLDQLKAATITKT